MLSLRKGASTERDQEYELIAIFFEMKRELELLRAENKWLRSLVEKKMVEQALEG